MDVFSKVNKWLVWGMGIVFAMGSQSCLDDDNDNWYGKVIPNALVTVKNVDDGSFFLQLDDSTTLLPINVASSPFGEKEVRALVNYDEVDEVSGRYSKAVHINWIDSILTKPIAPDLGEENDVVYGTDPVEIVRGRSSLASTIIKFRRLIAIKRFPFQLQLHCFTLCIRQITQIKCYKSICQLSPHITM